MQLTNSILILGATASVAFAQSMSTTSTAMTPQQTCLSTCNPGDVNCQAACLGNPYPNDSDANNTTECSKKCPQGNGTQAETEAYAACLQRCRSSFFPVGTGVYNGPTAAPATATVSSDVSMTVGSTTPMETGSSSSGSGSGSSSDSSNSGDMSSESGSASMSSGPSASTSGSAAMQTGAAGVNSVSVSSFSLIALVAAIFSL